MVQIVPRLNFREVLLMTKRILALVLSGVMILSTGCGLSSGTKDKLFGDSDVSKLVANAVTFSNYELLDEYFKSDKISQDLMDDMLGTAMYTNDSYRMTNYLFENGADPNSDMQLVWDAVYNGWYIRTMPFIHHPDFDINKKNNQGHSILYMTLGRESVGNEWTTYKIAEELINNGAEIEENFFRNNDNTGDFPYSQLLNSPKTAKMMIDKYISDGNSLGISKAIEQALSGDISSCLKTLSVDKTDISEDEISLIMIYASCYGTTDEYERLCELLESDTHAAYSYIAECGNVEMLDYFFTKEKVDLKADTDDLHYESYLDILKCAAAFGEYDVCEYLLDKQIVPLTHKYPSVLAGAILSENFELFEMLYDYIIENGDETAVDGKDKLSENMIYHIFLEVGKTTGQYDVTEYDKKIFDFFFEQGNDFSKVDISKFSNSKNNYMIKNGKKITEDDINAIIISDDKNTLQHLFDNKYDFTQSELEYAVKYSSSDIVDMFIENKILPDKECLKNSFGSSKAVVKLLIDKDVDTDIKLNSVSYWDGSVKHGDYTLKDLYEARGRKDLAELL